VRSSSEIVTRNSDAVVEERVHGRLEIMMIIWTQWSSVAHQRSYSGRL